MLANEFESSRSTKRKHPCKQVIDAEQSSEAHPKPNEYEELLIVQINWQCTFSGLPMSVLAQSTHIKIAHDDAWKVFRLPKVNAIPHVLEHTQAKIVEACSHEEVEQCKLNCKVYYVQNLHREETGR